MGRGARQKPARLSNKLVEIRGKLGLSQNGLIRRMGLADELTQAEVSAFERGIRLPPLSVLLCYADVANVYVDALIDDRRDLPAELPSSVRHEGVKHAPSGRRRR